MLVISEANANGIQLIYTKTLQVREKEDYAFIYYLKIVPSMEPKK